jgi:hypothetical protein
VVQQPQGLLHLEGAFIVEKELKQNGFVVKKEIVLEKLAIQPSLQGCVSGRKVTRTPASCSLLESNVFLHLP